MLPPAVDTGVRCSLGILTARHHLSPGEGVFITLLRLLTLRASSPRLDRGMKRSREAGRRRKGGMGGTNKSASASGTLAGAVCLFLGRGHMLKRARARVMGLDTGCSWWLHLGASLERGTAVGSTKGMLIVLGVGAAERLVAAGWTLHPGAALGRRVAPVPIIGRMGWGTAELSLHVRATHGRRVALGLINRGPGWSITIGLPPHC